MPLSMHTPFLLPESRCIGGFGDFKHLVWSIGGFVWQLASTADFPISSPLSKLSAHLLILEPVLSCFAPIQTETSSVKIR